MYEATNAQTISEKKLNKEGFTFSNWIPAQPDSEGLPSDDSLGTMILTRKPNRATTEYREIEPDGSIN